MLIGILHNPSICYATTYYVSMVLSVVSMVAVCWRLWSYLALHDLVLLLLVILYNEYWFMFILQQEGTLMGSAFATCFGYWFGISSLLWVISYVCSTRIAMTQLLNLLVWLYHLYKFVPKVHYYTIDKVSPLVSNIFCF